MNRSTRPLSAPGAVIARGVTSARVLASILRIELGPAGWGGVALLVLSAALYGAARSGDAEAGRLRDEAKRVREAAARSIGPPSEAGPAPAAVAGRVAGRVAGLRLPDGPSPGAVLPSRIFAQAERSGIRLGTVEYRWQRGGERIQRIDVQISASGRYLAARSWLADTLAVLPHAQLVDLSLQRAATSDAELEIRIVLAVHFGVRT